MSRYIKITIANDVRCSVSQGLMRIICFIGNDDRETQPNLVNLICYKKGKAIIDRRLRGTCKTAINNLVYAKREGKDASSIRYVWKLHRYKAYKALHAIKNELDQIKTPDEISVLFQDIFVILYSVFNGDIEHTAPEVLGRSYIRDLNNKLYDSSYEKDWKHIDRIIRSFNAYNVRGF